MSKAVVVPLESYRLIEYAQPIDCYICGGQNNSNAEFCRHCEAPMALAHQAIRQNTHPSMVAVVGASSVGKTVYLGMLMDMLSRRAHPLQVLARGAFSITLQQTTVSALARCEFPEKTPNEPDRWHWVHCKIRRPQKRRTLELIVPDMSGEAVLDEVNHPQSSPVIRSFLEKCSGAMILVDALRLHRGDREPDYFSMKFLGYLSELGQNGRDGWRKKPVALILTKADQCPECRADPENYAKYHASGLWQNCQEHLDLCRFFAAGVAGACTVYQRADGRRAHVPLRIEPHGVVEPFDWLLSQLKWQKATG
jgi:hypothetical protein